MLGGRFLAAALLYLAFKLAFEDSVFFIESPTVNGTCGKAQACPPHSNCTNTPDGPKCLCHPGYEKTEDGRCDDIDECVLDECGDNECVNFVASYECRCAPGLSFQKENKTCADIDECLKAGLCNSDRQCINTKGSYLCSCMTGFNETSIKTCEDVDECSDPEVCGNNANCSNTVGSYLCTCGTGYEMLDKKCEDIDECKKVGPDRLCPDEQQCINSQGAHFCQDCPTGESLNTYTNECEGPDMCTPNPCKSPATCETKGDEFQCSCPHGYEVKGKTECKEIDACKSNPCGANGKCIKDGVSFKCECSSGYKFDTAKGCVDVDECTMDLCKGAKCTNSMGSYECQCPEGSIFDAKTGCKNKVMPVVAGSYRPKSSPFCGAPLVMMFYFCSH